MKLPLLRSGITTAPDLEDMLARLPLDQAHLSRLAMQDHGLDEAKRYAENVFEAQFGDDIQKSLALVEAQKSEVTRLEDQFAGARERVGSIERCLPLADADKPPMPIVIIVVQTILAASIVLLLGVGCHNFATLLIKSGEPFLTRPWMAYVTSLGAATVFAIIIKLLISVPHRDEIKRLIATVALGCGVLSGLCYLAILSHIVKPEFGETNIEQLIPAFGATQTTGAVATTPRDLMSGSGRDWLLFFQFIAEATGAAGLGYFFSRNLRDHRAACARRNPEHIEAEKTVESAAARVLAAKDRIGSLEGRLRVLREVRALLISLAVSHVSALQRVIQTVFATASIKPHWKS